MSTLFPVKGQAYSLGVKILSSATANPITGGLTGIDVEISKDFAAFANIGGSFAEIGTSGYIEIALSSVDMTANSIILRAIATNTNAVEASVEIKPADLSEPTGHWLEEVVKRLEQGILQSGSWLLNETSMNKNTGTQTLYKLDGTTEVGTMSYTDDGTTISRGKLS